MNLQVKVFQRTMNVVAFVSDYADEHLCVAGAPTGLCEGCEHYREADADDEDDWCWLKEGKYTDGREHECPAWKSHNVGAKAPT